MQTLTMPASQYFAKPIIDFVQSKIEIMKRLDENNRLRDADESLKATLPRIGGGVKTTAEKLLQLFIKKFKAGKLGTNFKLSFTYSYFMQHVDGRAKKTALKEHFIRLCDSFKSILSRRYRDTLTLPGRVVNCITLEFAPGIIQYTQPAYNQMHDVQLKPPVIQTNLSRDLNPQKSQVIHSSDGRSHQTQKISSILSTFLKPT